MPSLIEIIHYNHFGWPEQEPYDAPEPPLSLTQQYPNLDAVKEELLRVVLELLEYQNGCRGGLSATCRRAERALETAQKIRP